jgi:tRNA(fMet)-specific endonuclease VapC
MAGNVKMSTTPITACELFQGAHRSGRREAEVNKVKKMLGYLDMLSFSVEASEVYGRLVNGIQGSMIGDLDAMIASLALTSKESIITSNVKHFERVPGLLVETW